MPSKIIGLKELQRQLKNMEQAAAGKALRSAALSAMLPVLRTAQATIPVGAPPYDGRDPYPRRTYLGRLVTPGFSRRSVARKTRLSRDKRFVKAMVGVKPEAFTALNFIEFGTSRTPRRPWLQPAFRSNVHEVDKRFRKRLKKLIDKAAKK